jgi:hypothetical protein
MHMESAVACGKVYAETRMWFVYAMAILIAGGI